MNNNTNMSNNTISLNKTLFAVSKNGKWGIQDDMGNQIISYQYDGITGCNNCIAVLKDNKVGLLNDKGITIIPPCYSYIECVNNNSFYNKEYPFDTSLIRHMYGARVGNTSTVNQTDVICSSYNHNVNKLVDGKVAFDTNKVFILQTESYSELFSLERGTFRSSRYSEVYQLTDIFFCVKKDEHYGIYDINTESLSIECEYQRIVYEGKNVVKIQKNNLWGVKSIAKTPDEIINILPQYRELYILDESECYFSVKCNKFENYELIDRNGEIINFFTPHHYSVGSHFEWHSKNLILTSIDLINKKVYGFVSTSGRISIPFKYDYVKKREDGNFDVNVCLLYEYKWGNTYTYPITLWGVLCPDGNEIVPLKYAKKLPSSLDFIIVKDSLSGFYGLLASSGDEIIPCKYQRLMWSSKEDFLFFCHDGIPKGKEDTFLGMEGSGEWAYIKANFFCHDIDYGTWGCIKKDGTVFIEAKYDCFKENGDYITAGRNGSFVRNDDGYGEDYDGVYDLYDKEGNLIIGGFNKFLYDETHSLLIFRFGGGWASERNVIPDVYPTVSYVSNYFDDRNSRWLIVTKELESVLRLPNGTRKVFDKGFIETIHEQEKESRREKLYWSIPLELLSKDEPIINDDIIICGDGKKKYSVNIETGSMSEIEVIIPSREKTEPNAQSKEDGDFDFLG